jgi:hypothetical protein
MKTRVMKTQEMKTQEMKTQQMKTQEHIVAVVEPARDGEATLDVAQKVVRGGGRATVVVLVSRKTMRDVRDFAEAENLTVPDASEIYFERLAETYTAIVGGADTATVVTQNASSGRSVFDLASHIQPTSIAMPQRVANQRGWRSSVARSAVPVLITPPAAAAA